MNVTTSKKSTWLPIGAALVLAVATLVSYPGIATAADLTVTLELE